MKTKLSYAAAVTAIITVCFSACNKEIESTDTQYSYLDLPQSPYNYNTGNPDEVVTLGRVLFYDGRLSVNSSISCGTCHKQSIAFSDDMQFSRGFQNKLTARNTLPIQNINSGFFDGMGGGVSLFWDGRESSLNSMVIKPILNHVEMGMDDEGAIVEKLRAAPYYAGLFNDAFGSSDITINRVSEALAAFTGSITSHNTRLDQSLRGSSALSAEEELGRNLFFTKYDCNNCHQVQEPSGYQMGGGFSNIGLNEDYVDEGVGSITQFSEDDGKFKIPNLRNIALTAPYMHDGRFATLDEVIDHYSTGIVSHRNLDVRLMDNIGQPLRLNIADHEKAALIAFMNTLTDYTMITDAKFSNPFKKQ